jgi:AAA15 family ATPase/GTPase
MTYFDYLNEDKGIEKINEIIGLFDTGIIQAETKDVSIDELKEIVPENLYQKLMDDLKNKVEEKEGNEEVSFTLRGPKAFYRIKANKENFMNPFVRTIVFVHDYFNRAKFSLDEESDGTIRLFELLEILLSDEEDKIYVIDEKVRSLHPFLTYSFIEKYICQLEKRNIQLIFTTHESTIMDQDLLRRDEVWFVDKNSNNNSILYSLDKFNQRIDKRLDKAYLDGRYGGVPIISKCNNKVN